MNASRIPLVIGMALTIGAFAPAGLARSSVWSPRSACLPREQAAERPASSMKTRVEAALRADPRLRGNRVVVRSAKDGVVVLAGTARTMSDHLRATADAARVPGVHRVANEVKTQDVLLAEAESRGEGRPPDVDRSYDVPDSAREMWTTSATRARVLADSPSPGLGLVNVDTHDGAVRLLGGVPPERIRAAVEGKARKAGRVMRRRHPRPARVTEEVRR